MALSGFTWYQGEANVDERRGDEGAARYSCTFPGMITQWRQAPHGPWNRTTRKPARVGRVRFAPRGADSVARGAA